MWRILLYYEIQKFITLSHPVDVALPSQKENLHEIKNISFSPAQIITPPSLCEEVKKDKTINEVEEMHKEEKKPYFSEIKRKPKYRWQDPISGYGISGGGIIFYDEEGMWIIRENNKHGPIFTDMGGKYEVEDGNIYATISRELSEESYHTCELTYSQILTLSGLPRTKRIYINDREGFPIYICLMVFTKDAELYGVKPDQKKFNLMKRDSWSN
jgi:hypothetical protein